MRTTQCARLPRDVYENDASAWKWNAGSWKWELAGWKWKRAEVVTVAVEMAARTSPSRFCCALSSSVSTRLVPARATSTAWLAPAILACNGRFVLDGC